MREAQRSRCNVCNVCVAYGTVTHATPRSCITDARASTRPRTLHAASTRAAHPSYVSRRRFTHPENRAFAFTIFYAVLCASCALGGLVITAVRRRNVCNGSLRELRRR